MLHLHTCVPPPIRKPATFLLLPSLWVHIFLKEKSTFVRRTDDVLIGIVTTGGQEKEHFFFFPTMPISLFFVVIACFFCGMS